MFGIVSWMPTKRMQKKPYLRTSILPNDKHNIGSLLSSFDNLTLVDQQAADVIVFLVSVLAEFTSQQTLPLSLVLFFAPSHESLQVSPSLSSVLVKVFEDVPVHSGEHTVKARRFRGHLCDD